MRQKRSRPLRRKAEFRSGIPKRIISRSALGGEPAYASVGKLLRLASRLLSCEFVD